MNDKVIIPADKFDTAMTFVKPEDAPTRVPLDNLAVLPGFNTRVKDADYADRVAGIAESIVANGFFDDKPFAVTMIPGDDKVYIYDGEHRFDAAKQALLDGAEFPDGLPVAWAKDGATVKDLTIHLAHGNAGERLNMVEMAAVVRRMQGLGMDQNEIAEALGRTTRHVNNLFVLAAANKDIKKAVASGKIAGAEAVKFLRKDKTTAAAKIAEAVKKAEEKGAKKATPKTMADTPKRKTVTTPGSLNFPAGSKMGDNLKSLAGSIREMLDIGEDDILNDEDVLIRFSVTKVDKAAEAEAAKKAEEKAAAAKAAAEAKALKLKEREEKAAAKAKEKAEAAAKRVAEKALLAEASKKGSAAKKTVSVADAKAKAKAHLSGDKAPSKGKTAGKAPKAEEAAPAAKAPRRRKKAESAPVEAEAGESTGLSDESMGGL